MDVYWFDTSGQFQKQSNKQVDTRDSDGESKKQNVCCAVCRNTITSADDAIQVQGSHEHAKVNPAGRSFLILCFSGATGCRPNGEATTYHSWFTGYSWRFAHCTKCDIQLGWFFEGNNQFVALIQEQLVPCDS